MHVPPEGHFKSASSEAESVLKAVIADSNQTMATATLLPPAAYTSQAFYDLEVQRIFKRDWLCVGHVSQVANVGDYFTLDLLGELLVVVRAKDRIRVLSRVCLHRWAQVVSGEGNKKAFVCPFHGWTYALDGQLMNAMFMDQAAGFEPSKCQLPEVRSEIVEALGLIFITFADKIDSINERLGDLSARPKNYHMNELTAVKPGDTDDPFNWKIGISTGMEIYHHFVAHRETFERTHPTRNSQCEEKKRGWTVCHAGAAGDGRRSAELPFFPDLQDEEKKRMDLYYIYPSVRLIVYPDTVRVRVIIPIGPARTKTKGFNLVRPEVAAQPELIQSAFASTQKFMQQVGREDDEISLMQQRGASSALACAGRISHHEVAVWHLAEYVRARIAAD